MKRFVSTTICVFAVVAIMTILALTRRHVFPDRDGVSAASLYHPPLTAGAKPITIMCYTGRTTDRPSTLLQAAINESENITADRSGPAPNMVSDGMEDTSGQYAGADKFYSVGNNRAAQKGCVFVTQLQDGEWKTRVGAVLDVGRNKSWDSLSITWISIMPPGEINKGWKMWYVGRGNGPAKIGLAKSQDGISWTRSPQPVYDPGNKETAESISVVTFAGGMQAWMVQRNLSTKAAQLFTVTIDPVDGSVNGLPEPVAWQAPKDWRQGLPRGNIPIVDARADPVGDDPRHVRLFITYIGPDGKTRITVAENFPVNGIRLPNVFSRQVRPVLEPSG
jgi:hypothetical protein